MKKPGQTPQSPFTERRPSLDVADTEKDPRFAAEAFALMLNFKYSKRLALFLF